MDWAFEGRVIRSLWPGRDGSYNLHLQRAIITALGHCRLVACAGNSAWRSHDVRRLQVILPEKFRRGVDGAGVESDVEFAIVALGGEPSEMGEGGAILGGESSRV